LLQAVRAQIEKSASTGHATLMQDDVGGSKRLEAGGHATSEVRLAEIKLVIVTGKEHAKTIEHDATVAKLVPIEDKSK
jgi:hypothetical protein